LGGFLGATGVRLTVLPTNLSHTREQVAEKHLLFRLLKNGQMQGTRQFSSASGGPKSEAYIGVRRNDEE
jgi:hypothetical protein